MHIQVYETLKSQNWGSTLCILKFYIVFPSKRPTKMFMRASKKQFAPFTLCALRSRWEIVYLRKKE